MKPYTYNAIKNINVCLLVLSQLLIDLVDVSDTNA